jgi:hypothetical protein
VSGRKWQRAKPGTYTSGPFRIIGGGAAWNLYRQDKLIDCFPSKKAAQEHVEQNPDAGLPPKPKAERGPAPKDSLESVLASLRLEISRLTDMVGLLATKIDQLGG